MAKIVIAGEAVVITSAVKLEDYRKVAKYRPKALVLMGGEDGKEPIFRVGVTNGGAGTIGKYGAEFATATHDEQKLASITMVYTGKECEDIKETVADEIGPAVMLLNKLEATLPDVLAEIDAEKAQILENITVAQ